MLSCTSMIVFACTPEIRCSKQIKHCHKKNTRSDPVTVTIVVVVVVVVVVLVLVVLLLLLLFVTTAMPGIGPVLDLFLDLSISTPMFNQWLMDDSLSFDEAVKRALALRASCEVRMRRVLLQQGTPPQATYSWHSEVRLFAREDAWVPFATLRPQSKMCVVLLLKRLASDGFRTQQRGLHTNDLLYKHFAYNALLSVGLERGLGLVLLVAAVEKLDLDTAPLITIIKALKGKVSVPVHEALLPGGSYLRGNAVRSLPKLVGVGHDRSPAESEQKQE